MGTEVGVKLLVGGVGRGGGVEVDGEGSVVGVSGGVVDLQGVHVIW